MVDGLGHQVNLLAWSVHLIVINESQGSLYAESRSMPHLVATKQQ